MLTVYGLPNCDTCRKAQKWLEAQGAPFTFHDVRADGLKKTDLQKWIKLFGAETVVNRRSTTWRGLDEKIKNALTDKTAPDLLMENPTLLKRPVFDFGSDVVIGFTAKQQAALKTRL